MFLSIERILIVGFDRKRYGDEIARFVKYIQEIEG